jgi:ADP-ribosylglycohydrolase
MLYERILGGLLGGAIGDAMGAPTEGHTPESILQYFGHRVTGMEAPLSWGIACENIAGQVTDDFSGAYFIAQEIIKNRGNVSDAIICQALLNWTEYLDGAMFHRFGGPTTRRAMNRIRGESVMKEGFENKTLLATNGSAMRIAPIGFLNAGNVEKAIADAVTVSLVTHDNNLAISGACAVAAACSRAVMPDADLLNVLQAGIYGAVEGDRIGREVAYTVAGPSVVKRMEYSIELGLGKGTVEEKVLEIGDTVGCGLHVAEAVGAAFGILAANGGDALATIVSGVNLGHDSDTVSTIAGSIAGAMQGSTVFAKEDLITIEHINQFNLVNIAHQISKIALTNGGPL